MLIGGAKLATPNAASNSSLDIDLGDGTIRRMSPLQLAIRNAISDSGGRAASSLIAHRLRKAGLRVNRHTLLKALRLPDFVLTNGGWANTLRQTTIFELLENKPREAACVTQ